MVGCNGLILVSVGRTKHLRERKEILVLCLLVLSDLLYGIPTIEDGFDTLSRLLL